MNSEVENNNRKNQSVQKEESLRENSDLIDTGINRKTHIVEQMEIKNLRENLTKPNDQGEDSVRMSKGMMWHVRFVHASANIHWDWLNYIQK